jgi:hypothetical protein
MFTYKRRVPPLLIIDGTPIAPAFVLAGRKRRRDRKRQEQIDLHGLATGAATHSPCPRAEAADQHR